MHPKIFQLEAFFEKYEHIPKMNVLGASDAETFTIKDLLDLSGKRYDLGQIKLGYGKVKGWDELRDAVAKSYREAKLSTKNVLITVGATESIFLALHTLIKPGDEALICWPIYQGLQEMVETAGGRVAHYEYLPANNFAPDLNAIRDALKRADPPKVLLLNTPHNPTGHALDRKTLKELLALARHAKTRVVVDEVFSKIRIGKTKLAPSAVELDSRAIVIGSLSKVYGLAGLRIGWLVGPQDFIEECKNLRYYTSLVQPSVVQHLGKIAIESRRRIQKRTQNNVNQNYAYATKWLKKHRRFFKWFPPQAGLVMLLQLKLSVNTKRFAETLAQKHKVFLVPCTIGFGMRGRYLRLGLGGNPQKFEEGLGVLGTYLRSKEWRLLGRGDP